MDFNDRKAEALRFLEALWGGASRSADLVISVIGKDEHVHPVRFPSSSLEVAAQEAVQASLEPGINVYASCCLLDPASAQEGKRGDAAAAVAMAAAWVDLDIAGPAHKSDALPPTREAGVAILQAVAPTPSLIIDSGWGLYGWWLFARPLSLSESDRRLLERIELGCQAAVRGIAAKNGWTVDQTADLARILRLPGTTNWKIPDDPRVVRVLHDSGARYTKADLAHWADVVPVERPAAEPFAEHITSGHRTKSVESLAGRMRYWNESERAAEAAALIHNAERCTPPLPTQKVRDTVAGIFKRYEPGVKPTLNGNGDHGLKGVLLSSVTPRHVEWLWHPFLPLGKLVIHAGEPGLMKSSFDVAIAANITNGTGFAERFGPRNVVFFNFEDDDEDGLVPRLLAAGADVDRCISVPDIPEGVEAAPVLAKIVRDANPLAVFVDPFGSWAEATENTGVETQVRKSLRPLKQLATTSGALVKVNCHPNKQNSLSDALYRIAGSLGGMVGYARVVLASKREDDKFLAGIVKSNVGPNEVGVEYYPSFVPVEIDGRAAVYPRVLFGAEVPIERAKFFEAEDEGGQSKTEACAEAIIELLGKEPKFARDMNDGLYKLGFSKSVIRAGRAAAGVAVTGAGPGTRWHPPECPTTAPPYLDLTESEVDVAESQSKTGGCCGDTPEAEDGVV